MKNSPDYLQARNPLHEDIRRFRDLFLENMSPHGIDDNERFELEQLTDALGEVMRDKNQPYHPQLMNLLGAGFMFDNLESFYHRVLEEGKNLNTRDEEIREGIQQLILWVRLPEDRKINVTFERPFYNDPDYD